MIVGCIGVLALAGIRAEGATCTLGTPSRSSIVAGSSDTTVTFSQSGFGTETTAFLALSSPPGTTVPLFVTVGPTQLQFTIPGTYLATPQTLGYVISSSECTPGSFSGTLQVTAATPPVPPAAVGLPNSANAHIPVIEPIGAHTGWGRGFFSSVASRSSGGAGWSSCQHCHGDLSDSPKGGFSTVPTETLVPAHRALNWTAIFDEIDDYERVPGADGGGGGKTASEVQNFIANAFTQPGGLKDYGFSNPVMYVNPNTGMQTTIVPLLKEFRPGSYPFTIYLLCSSQASMPGTVAKGCSLSVEKTLKLATGGAGVMNPDGQGITFACSPGSASCPSVTAGDASTLVFGSDSSAIVTHTNQVKEYFNSSGQLVRVFDPRGPDLNITLDTQGDASEVDDNFGIRITITRGSGEVTVSDQASRSAQLSISSDGSLAAFTNAGGDTYGFTGGLLNGSFISITDPAGNNTSVGFTGSQVGTITNAGGGVKVFAYSSSSTNVTDELGNVTIYQFDSGFRTTYVTNAVGATWGMTFGSNGALATVTDPRGFVRSWQTDANLNISKYIDQAGDATTFSYNANNARTKLVDALRNAALAAYDSHNQPTSITDFLGNPLKLTYEPKGRVASETYPNGVTDEFVWDDTNHAVTITFAAGTPSSDVVQTTFDANGHWITRKTPNRMDTAAYNLNDQLVQLVLGAGRSDARTVRHYYDSRGNEIKMTDPRGVNTTWTYNALNDPIQIVRAAGLPEQSVTKFGYNLAADIISRTNPLGGVTLYTLNPDHQVVGVEDPVLEDRVVQRDLDGNVIQTIDPDGKVVSYDRDARELVVKKTLSDGTVVSFTYDLLGRRSSMTDPTGTTTYQYDANGRVTNVTDPTDKSVGSEYDAVGNRVELTLPDGTKFKNDFSALGLVTDVTHSMLGKIMIGYDSGLNANQIIYSNGVIYQKIFDPFHEPIQEVDTRGSHTLFSISNTFDAAGNGTSTTIGSSVELRAFDGLNRVTKDTLDGIPTLASYDANSDLLSYGSNALTYNLEGGLTGFNLATVSNDLDGNLVSGVGQTIGYNAEELVRTFGGPTTGTALYISNGDGVLTDENTSKGSYHFVYDGFNRIQESGPQGTIDYVRLGNTVLATINTTTGQIFTPAHDAAGSPTVVIDGAGKVEAQYEFNSLGSPLGSDPLGLTFEESAFGCTKDPGSGELRCGASPSLYNTATGRTNDQVTLGGLWPPNHGYSTIGLGQCCGCGPAATGACNAPAPAGLGYVVAAVESAVPRAERRCRSRMYTIYFQPSYGTAGAGPCSVMVPHDFSGGASTGCCDAPTQYCCGP